MRKTPESTIREQTQGRGYVASILVSRVCYLTIAAQMILMGGFNAASAAPVGTAISYQGDLQKQGSPVTANCDFRFRLFDDEAAGMLIGSEQLMPNISVTNGLFLVNNLDFGAGAFDGDARWLDISVKCPGDTDFIALSPRQAITPTPYALRATEGIGDPNVLTIGAGGRVAIGSSQPLQPGIPFFRSTAAPSAGVQTCAEDPLSGKIYCFAGGQNGIGYDPVLDELASLTSPPQETMGRSCVGSSLTGTIFCFGGIQFFPTSGNLDEIVEYDPTTDSFTERTATLPGKIAGLDCVERPGGGSIFCFGGARDDSVWVCQGGSNHGAMCTSDADCFDGGLCNGVILQFTQLDSILEYDPGSDTLTIQAATLPSPRGNLRCAASQSTGKIYCFGGSGESGGFAVPIDEIIAYDPSTDSLAIEPTHLPAGGNVGNCFSEGSTGLIECFGVPPFISDVFTYNPVSHTLVANGATLPCGNAIGSLLETCVLSSTTGHVYCIVGCDSHVLEYIPTPFEPLLQVGDPGDGSGALANTWSVFSSRSYKTDIEPLAQQDYLSILAKIRTTEVVHYRYRNDAGGERRLGVVAEDSPREILSPDGRGVSLSDYSAFLLAAIKAQQLAIEEKDAQLKALEAQTGIEMSALRARVESLETTSRSGPALLGDQP